MLLGSQRLLLTFAPLLQMTCSKHMIKGEKNTLNDEIKILLHPDDP